MKWISPSLLNQQIYLLIHQSFAGNSKDPLSCKFLQRSAHSRANIKWKSWLDFLQFGEKALRSLSKKTLILLVYYILATQKVLLLDTYFGRRAIPFGEIPNTLRLEYGGIFSHFSFVFDMDYTDRLCNVSIIAPN